MTSVDPKPVFSGCTPDGACLFETMNDLDFARTKDYIRQLVGCDVTTEEVRTFCRSDSLCMSQLVQGVINEISPDLIEQLALVQGEEATQRALQAVEDFNSQLPTPPEGVVLEFPQRKLHG